MKGLWLVVLAACLGACHDRDGTYLVIDGVGVGAFDRVEFYFGKPAGTSIPFTPTYAAAPGERQQLFYRLYAETDHQVASGGHLTYYLGDIEDNQDLGSYVIAIASRGDVPVGIAELPDFEVASDAMYVYELALAPFDPQQVERWGRRPEFDGDACVRWTRTRDGEPQPSTFVIGRRTDLDCDGFRNFQDCAPVAYCDPTDENRPCATGPCLIDEPSCMIGVCQNQDGTDAVTCTPTACVVEDACSRCDLDAPAPEAVACAMEESATHQDYVIPLQTDGTLCGDPYVFRLVLPNSVICAEPEIEVVLGGSTGRVSPFTFEILQDGSVCRVSMRAPTPETRLEDIPHVMFSVASNAAGGRQAIIFGVRGEVGLCGEQTIALTNPLGVCP